MATYHKVSKTDVSKETELAVTLVPAAQGTVAYISDPTVSDKDTMPVPEALAAARRAIEGDLNPRELVIVDENDLWEAEWGDLEHFR